VAFSLGRVDMQPVENIAIERVGHHLFAVRALQCGFPLVPGRGPLQQSVRNGAGGNAPRAQLSPAVGGLPLRLAVDVAWRNGIKEVVLRSSVTLTNHCPHALDYLVVADATAAVPVCLGSLRSGRRTGGTPRLHAEPCAPPPARLFLAAAQPSGASTKSKDWIMLESAELAPPAEYANAKPGEFRDADGVLQAFVGTIGTRLFATPATQEDGD